MKRDEFGRVLPGQGSLNPGGRPRGIAAAIKAKTNNFEALFDYWKVVMDDPKARPADRLRASENLAAYGIGKPVQQIESRNVNINTDLPEGRVPLPLENLSPGLLGELLELTRVTIEAGALALPPMVEGEIVPEPAPEPVSTDAIDSPTIEPHPPAATNGVSGAFTRLAAKVEAARAGATRSPK